MFGKCTCCVFLLHLPFHCFSNCQSFLFLYLSGTISLDFFNFEYIFPCFADLVNVFEVFLPQLLLYPNPSDPLNGEAAALMMRDRNTYEQRVKGINYSSKTYENYEMHHLSLP